MSDDHTLIDPLTGMAVIDTCKCLSVQSTLTRALHGETVERCEMHGTLGYDGHQAEPQPSGGAVALNSPAIEESLRSALNTHTDPFAPQPNL